MTRVLDSIKPEASEDVISEDNPLAFDPSHFADHLEALAMQEGGNASQFISMLVMRIRALLADTRVKDVINPDAENDITLLKWLENHVGANNSTNGVVSIIDFSLVPL